MTNWWRAIQSHSRDICESVSTLLFDSSFGSTCRPTWVGKVRLAVVRCLTTRSVECWPRLLAVDTGYLQKHTLAAFLFVSQPMQTMFVQRRLRLPACCVICLSGNIYKAPSIQVKNLLKCTSLSGSSIYFYVAGQILVYVEGSNFCHQKLARKYLVDPPNMDRCTQTNKTETESKHNEC